MTLQTAYKNKLKRLGHQTALSRHLLSKHPSVQNKLTIVQTLLHYLNLQTEWMSAGPTARLLMTFKAALQGQELEKSQTGFIGPSFALLQKRLADLMHASLPKTEQDHIPLLLTFTQVAAIGTIFITTQLAENGKVLLSLGDPVTEKRAGHLFKELGLTFILGSGCAHSLFRSVTQGLHLSESSQKRIGDIGVCFLLTLLILAEEDLPYEEEFFETIKKLMIPTFESIEYALLEAKEEKVFEEDKIFTALNQLQLVKTSLKTRDGADLKKALVLTFDSLNFPYQELKNDVNRLISFCAKLNESFKNIFYQSKITTTTVIHA